MGEIVNLFAQAAFDPGEIEVLCAAYEKARQALHDKGQPDIVNEIIARRILTLARTGERDAGKLCAGALSALGDKLEF